MVAIVGGVLVGVLVCAASFQWFFPREGDFSEVIYYYFKPDFLSLMDGEYTKDRMCEFKLGAWTFLGSAAGAATFLGIQAVSKGL
jgi:hypothetical protein